MSFFSGLERLLGFKQKPQPQSRPAHIPIARYEDGSARVGRISVGTGQPHPLTPGVQGYPQMMDDRDTAGGVGMAPQATVVPQYSLQPTQRPFQTQGSLSPYQPTANPQLDILRRLLGL